MLDIVIQQGTIVDGGKRKPFVGDIGIADGEIKDISAPGSLSAATTIDAKGLMVSPGFIDITNHSDTHWTLFNYPMQESMVRQGITTIIGGSCGSSLAPLTKGIEGMQTVQKWIDTSDINTNWLSMAEFLEEINRQKLGVNFGTLVGHGTLRRSIMGDTAKPASADELERMNYLLERSLFEGAFGLSFGLAFSHGRPASEEELLAFLGTLAAKNCLVTIHLRDEGKDFLPSITEVIRLARASGARMHIVHFKALGREAWDTLPRALQLLRAAGEEGMPLTISTFPYTKTGSLLYSLLPPWARDGGKNLILSRLNDHKQKMLLMEDLRSLTFHYDRITIASAKKTRQLAGKTIQEISKNWEKTPEEVLLEILVVNELGVTIFGEAIQDKHIEKIYLEPYAYFSSDGIGVDAGGKQKDDILNLIHPRSFGASARFLGEYVRNRSLIPWERAIHMMTKGVADIVGITDRGILSKSAKADVVVFDPKTIEDEATFEHPYRYPNGILWVLVNGQIVVENGALSAVRNGIILKKEKK